VTSKAELGAIDSVLARVTGPAIVLTFSVDSVVAMSAAASDLLDFRAAFATSNSACAKPIGWVHCCLVELSNWVQTCAVVWPVSELVKGGSATTSTRSTGSARGRRAR